MIPRNLRIPQHVPTVCWPALQGSLPWELSARQGHDPELFGWGVLHPAGAFLNYIIVVYPRNSYSRIVDTHLSTKSCWTINSATAIHWGHWQHALHFYRVHCQEQCATHLSLEWHGGCAQQRAHMFVLVFALACPNRKPDTGSNQPQAAFQ